MSGIEPIGAPRFLGAPAPSRLASRGEVSAPRDTVALTTVAPSTAPTEARTWQDEIFYFVMTDRFENGDKTNDAGSDRANSERFHGGDWQGVIDRLDDLQKLGVTALWISPIVLNDRDFLGIDGYHGYWPHDFDQAEPSFGTREKLKELVDRAHARGIKIVVDLVLNHTGYNHPWTKDGKHEEYFHHNEHGMINGSLWGLPDLKQEDPRVAQYLTENAVNWANELGLDGYRLDAVTP